MLLGRPTFNFWLKACVEIFDNPVPLLSPPFLITPFPYCDLSAKISLFIEEKVVVIENLIVMETERMIRKFILL